MVAHFFWKGVGGKKGDSQADRGSAGGNGQCEFDFSS